MDDFNFYRPSVSVSQLVKHKRRYHIFLNFRGKEIRQSFVDHLYGALSDAGFHVYLDTESSEKGEDFWNNLVEAIRNSTVHIPIFSLEYATSNWPLDELLVIWNCKSTCPETITIPLFYNVEPSEVRYQKGIYGKSLEELSTKRCYTTEQTDKWKKALHNVSLLSGWSLKLTAGGYEGKLIKQVVKDLLETLKIDRMYVAKYEVGLSDPKKEVIKLLEIHRDLDVLTVGIWGTVGIGKTTLSLAVHNDIHRLFEASCFVSDISVTVKESPNHLVDFQKQILSELGHVKGEFSSVNLGITQMETHLSSRKVLLILDGVDDENQLIALLPNRFGPGSRIIITCRDKKVLRCRKIGKIHPVTGLGQHEGVQLFSLHAFSRACPENGYEHITEKIVNSCQGVPLLLENLGLHLCDERNMGIWSEALEKINQEVYLPHKIIYDALSDEEKNMFLDIACIFVIISNDFLNKNLTFYLDFWKSRGCKNVDTSLRSLQEKSLVRIDYSGSHCRFWMYDRVRDFGRQIVEDESPRDPSQRSRVWCKKDILSVLKHAEKTTKVRGLMLTGLELDHMDNLALIHNLEFLFCWDLQETTMLPSDLRYLFLSRCAMSYGQSAECFRLRKTLGQLQFLCYLHISDTTLPDEVGHLHSLKQLHITKSPQRKFPRCIKNLLNLQELNLEICHELDKLPALPEGLDILSVDDCPRLKRFCNMSHKLETLNLSGCSELKELPPLPESLKHIKVKHCPKLQKLSCMSHLVNLETLNVSSCSSLNQLPESNCMQSLREFTLSDWEHLEELPPLPKGLLKLTLDRCKNLKELPPLPKGLRKLTLDRCKNLKELPPLPKGLLKLTLDGCKNLKELPTLPKGLLKLTLDGCKNLKELPPLPEGLLKLTLDGCKNLKELPPLPEGLIYLSTLDCHKLQINASQVTTKGKAKHMTSEPNNETYPFIMRLPKRSRTMESLPYFSTENLLMEQGESSISPLAGPDYDIP